MCTSRGSLRGRFRKSGTSTPSLACLCARLVASIRREFMFELLLASGRSQDNVTRLRNGTLDVFDGLATEVA